MVSYSTIPSPPMGQPQQGGLTQVPQPVGGANPYTTGGQIQPYTPMQQQQPMGQQAMPPMGSDTRQVQQQPGVGYGNPNMQAYYAQDAANQAQRSQMMQAMQGLGSQPGVFGGPMSGPNPMTPGMGAQMAPGQERQVGVPYSPNPYSIDPIRPRQPFNPGFTTGVYNGPFGADGRPAPPVAQPPMTQPFNTGFTTGVYNGPFGADGKPAVSPYQPPMGVVGSGMIAQPYRPFSPGVGQQPPMTPKPTNVWGSYGFDQPLTDYLNNQAMLSATDAAPSWRYDPATKMFTGYGMRGVQQQLSLADMQQRAASRPLINPYGPPPAGAVFGDARPVFEQSITGVYNGPFGANGLPSVNPRAGGDAFIEQFAGRGTSMPPMPPSLPTAVSPPMPALSPREQQREREKAWWADRERRQAARVARRQKPRGMALGGQVLSNVPQADTGFNINNAMNTFNQQLGARVASGQMTMDQARAAQAEMTALQRMPNATRQQATDVAQRQTQVGQYAPTPATPQGGLTLVNVPQQLRNAETRPMKPVEDTVGVNAEAGIPLWMRLGLPRPAEPAMPQADTGFNINNAMNTFNQNLGQRVASGQMTMDQARAAQAEMTALQRMPSATREQATNVAQSQLQVGPYAPQMPQALTEVIGSRMPPPGVRSGDTRIFADQPMQPAFNINNAMNTFNQSLGQRVASGQMTMDQARAAQAEMTALQRTANPTREQATNVAQSQLQVGPYAPQPRGIGAFLGASGQVPKGLGSPSMLSSRLRKAFSPRFRKTSGVDNSTFMAGDPNFRFGQTPQRMAPNAQGMALGGLMHKYSDEM